MSCEYCFYLGSTRVYSYGAKPEQNKRLCEDCADAMDLIDLTPHASSERLGED